MQQTGIKGIAVDFVPPSGFEWPTGWEPLPADNAFVEELQREVSSAHPLYKVTCLAVARHGAQDDILFLTEQPQMPLACVHLTWARESGEPFPWVQGYASWQAFQAAWSGSDD